MATGPDQPLVATREIVVVMRVVVGPAGRVLYGHVVDDDDQPIRSFVGLEDVGTALQEVIERTGAIACLPSPIAPDLTDLGPDERG
jgi:hypothetical protein